MASSQKDRPIQVETPLGKDVLLLEGLAGEEAVSTLFRYRLDLLTEKASVDPKQLLGKKASIRIRLFDDSYRTISGIVSRFSHRGTRDKFTVCSAEVVPTAWLLTLSRDWRVFTDVSTTEIVEKVLKAADVPHFRMACTGTYAKRPYCAQYGETHLDFISRLLEEEGIYYFFEHSDSGDTIVFADAPSAVKPVEGLHPIHYGSPDALLERDVVHSVEREDTVSSANVKVRDFDFTKANTNDKGALTSEMRGTSTDKVIVGEVFEYPGGFDTRDAGDRRARVRLEQQEALHQVLRGETTSPALETGRSFEIDGLPTGFAKGPFHALSLTLTARIPGGYHSGAGQGFEFQNTFTSIPSTVPYRPPRLTRKPVAAGAQTAMVTGPQGEEIYVDKYGRVKVQFHWDRTGKRDDKSSAWIRVSTSWAGKQWGMVQPPRVGQEVIVSFLEGDPDRPIVTGAVYNGDQMPPYALPDFKTMSGIKTRSSAAGGADNFNEIQFEDKKGSELVSVQAEKDLKTLVKNDETREVQHDRITTIRNDETKTIKEGNQTVTLEKGNQTLTLQQGNQTHTLEKGNQTLTIKKGNQTITISEGDQTMEIAVGKQSVTIKGDRKVQIKTGNDDLEVQTGNRSVVVTTGNHELDVKAGNATTKVTQGNLSTQVSMGNVSTKASLGSISFEGTQGIELKVGQNSIKIDASGVTVSGLIVKITGQVQTQVKGLMTQVNGDAMLQVKGGITMIN